MTADLIPQLDRVPFYIKRDAAIEAAETAFNYMINHKATDYKTITE